MAILQGLVVVVVYCSGGFIESLLFFVADFTIVAHVRWAMRVAAYSGSS